MEIKKYILRYFLAVSIVYMGLFLIEWFIIENFLYFLKDYAYIEFFIYMMLIIFINPILTYYFTKVKKTNN